LQVGACNIIDANFARLAIRRSATDGVPGDHVGAYHYGTTTNAYLDAVAASRHVVESLFEGTDNPVSAVRTAITAALQPLNLGFRLAGHSGKPAGMCVARSWNGSGDYILSPHEDAAQLQSAEQSGFEIQDVFSSTVVGVNLCVQNDSAGSALRLWNAMPDNNDRRLYGVMGTGYPYPIEYLEGLTSISIDIRAGDVYFINGKCIHAVTSPSRRGTRLTLSFMMGYVDNAWVVSWT
jgi:hypothetical protein